jgi:P27 family predicted phage terminase small subunit
VCAREILKNIFFNGVMMGRRAKPEGLKRAQGNPGKRKLTSGGTAFAVIENEEFPPSMHLSDEEKKIWRDEIGRIGNLNLLRQSDMSAFEFYVNTIKRYRDAKRVLDAEGTTYVVSSKHGEYRRKRPELDIEKECRRHIRDMQREFGMTSISRIRAHSVVAAMPPQQPNLPLSGGGNGPSTEMVPMNTDSPLGSLRAAGHA